MIYLQLAVVAIVDWMAGEISALLNGRVEGQNTSQYISKWEWRLQPLEPPKDVKTPKQTYK